ncbi:hypothetical protein Psfp_00823 [Pelotomaculum sp. FP]|uniref:hypothetical protein n=1 Tax=Pelotomaculum sp. FP TaxID=261474 RepID=UPI0010657E17|nr:hypothetical protein [Pelotomaculum sp. FP]TEB17089.1 hypothetical protein Psfp_00823 [Pelotomaculum sp. FP]
MIINEKCIYCNSTENLTESDIITYALTGAKLKKRFVCKKHNSYTNDKFESDCVKNWDFFRNQLGFTTREGNIVKYKGNIVIDDIVIKDVNLSDKKTFYTSQILSTTHNGHKVILGNSNLLRDKLKIEPTEIDSNKISMQYKFSLKELIISAKMKRTIAKIAYEWYCYTHDINGYQNQYDGIVSYILEGCEQESIVECVVDAYAFMVANQLCEIGTNSIYDYIDKFGNCYVVFNFWNIVIYKIKIHQNNTPVIKKENFITMERYNVDGTKDHVTFGVYSLNGGFDVISESCDEALNRLYNLYIKNLELLSTHTVLTIYTLKCMIDDLFDDITGLEKGKLTLSDLLEYEESKRIFIIQLALLFNESFSYNYDESFNSNLKNLLSSDEYFVVNKDELSEYAKKIVKLYEDGLLIQNLIKGIDYFYNCYEHEMKRINI